MGNNDITEFVISWSDINFIQIAFIIGIALLLSSASQRFFPWFANKFSGRVRFFFLGIVPVFRLLIIIISFRLIIPLIIEPNIENLVALFGAFGIALGFAFKDYASSLIAGIVTLYEMPYRTGDWIEINGTYGEVKSINMRAVRILTPDDTMVVIPHLFLWNQSIFNANNGDQTLQCVTDFYLHPNHDAALVKHTLYDVAITSPYLQIEQPILVIVCEKPWGTHYRLRAYPIDPRMQFNFKTDLTIRAKAVLIELGAEFTALPALPGPTPGSGSLR